MKLIILVAVVLVVLVLGGGAAYMTLFSPSEKTAEVEVIEEKEPDRDPADFVKLPLKPFMVPITSSKNTIIGVELTLADESAAEFAAERLPRLRSVILEELYEAADSGGKAGGVRDYDAIRSKLMGLVRDIVGREELVQIVIKDITKELSKPKSLLPKAEPQEKKSGGH